MSKDIIKKPATGLSKWLAKETLGNWIYDQLGTLAKSAVMTGLAAVTIRTFSAIPLDVWLIIGLFLIAVLVFAFDRVARRRGWLPFPVIGPEETPEVSTDEATGKMNTPDADLHAQCKNTIRLLQEDLAMHSDRADTNESLFKAFKEKYGLAVWIADYQAPEIGKFVEVVRVCTHDPKLDDPMPTIQWTILLKNRSVHRISLDGDVGPLFFEGHKLTEHKDVLENKVMGLYPDRDGSIVFEQRLSPSEVNLLKSSPNGKFEFDKVMLSVKGSDAEHVTSHRVVIFSRFRATLGRCSDERSQAAEELSTVVDSLRTQLVEAKSNSAGEKIAERKALIASWRASVAKAYRDYQDSGWSFTGLLATQDDYLSLTPNLSPDVKAAIEDAKHPDYDDVRRLVHILAEDIARIEREWGL